MRGFLCATPTPSARATRQPSGQCPSARHRAATRSASATAITRPSCSSTPLCRTAKSTNTDIRSVNLSLLTARFRRFFAVMTEWVAVWVAFGASTPRHAPKSRAVCCGATLARHAVPLPGAAPLPSRHTSPPSPSFCGPAFRLSPCCRAHLRKCFSKYGPKVSAL